MSTDSERDQSTDRILKKAVLRRTDADPGEACIDIDAETFAAWAEGALTEAEAARVETHLADCARCQAVMASFATSEPAAAASIAAPAVIPFRPKSTMRWLIPMVAGTAAASLLVWTAWPKSDAAVGTASQTMAKADAPAATPTPEALREEAGGRAALTKAETAAAQPKLAASKESKTKDEARPGELRVETATPTSRVANAAPAKPLAASPAAPAPPPPAYVPPPPAPAPRPLPGAMPPPAGTAQRVVAAAPPPTQAQQQSQQGTVRTEVPTVSQTISADMVQKLPRADRNSLMFVAFVPGMVEFSPADPQQRALGAAGGGGGARGGGGGAAAGGAAGAGGRSAAAAEVAIPLTNIRWRVLPTGEVGKTIDAGVTWQAITIDPPAHITNGAAPAATVCWLVGRGGAVLRSTDGIKFTPVTFPEAIDLRSITAIDARRATVTTVDGRTFTTVDAGLSWK